MDYKVTDTELTSVANAIRTKGGTSGQLTFPADFVTAIGNISGGGGSANILSGPYEPTASIGNDGSLYLQYGESKTLQPFVSKASDLSVIVTANSYWSGYEPWKAFTSDNGWIGNGGDPHWLQVEATRPVELLNIDFVTRDSGRSHAISRVEYSDDGINFTDAVLAESTMVSNVGHVEFDQYISGKYFRLYFDGNYGRSQYPMVGSLEMNIAGNFITAGYVKKNGVWQDLIGSDIDDVDTGD